MLMMDGSLNTFLSNQIESFIFFIVPNWGVHSTSLVGARKKEREEL
jgi:hypothetical protein